MIRFSKVREIAELEEVLKTYIHDAIEVEKAGLKVKYNDNSKLDLIDELRRMLDEQADFKTAFETLTPGRQRAYHMHFAAPVHSMTRKARIQKCMPRILDGKGLNDCTCGLSKKMPTCDGSHKFLQNE